MAGQDKLFQVNFAGKEKSIEDVLEISAVAGGHVNSYTKGSSIIINSDRLILNAKNNHAFLCGKTGITISSPQSIHIDTDNDIYLASKTEIYLGVPAKGGEKVQPPDPTTKASETKNVDYEPVVLGLKLANLLEDLLVILRDAVVRTPAGDGRFSAEMMYNFECLQARLPEILSTAVFVDGFSHDKVDDAPSVPTGEDILQPLQVTVNVEGSTDQGTAGSTVSGDTSSVTGTNTATNAGTATPQVGPTIANALAAQQSASVATVTTIPGIANATLSPFLASQIANFTTNNPDGGVGGP